MKIKKHLTRRIHSNRNLFWAVAISVIAGMALFSFITIKSYEFEQNSIFPDLKFKKIYTDPKLGFAVRYPRSWVLDRDASNNPVFINPHNNGESVSITSAPLDSEGIIRHSLQINEEKVSQRDGLVISRIKASTMRDVSDRINVAIIKTPTKIFYISGRSDSFDQFVNNFNILK